MELSIGKVVEKINSVAPDGLLDKSASPKTLHIDAANEYATESLQKCVDSRKAFCFTFESNGRTVTTPVQLNQTKFST